jgi:Reverse transcriptase (RNA-dependent DNA polymerase)/Endonuclease-reverse transcriptase
MYNSLRIVYWNCQGVRNKRSELIQLINKLKIDILMLNETHLNPKIKLKIPNYHIYRTDRQSNSTTNCGGGTAVLVHHKITHNLITIQTNSIENTTIHTALNGHEIRLGALYKSPRVTISTSDIDNLMNTNANVILAGDLNAKNPIWHSHSTNLAGRSLQNHMESHHYIITAPDTPTHFPDNHRHNPDVLDVAILKLTNFQFQITNLNELSSDHNPILLDINPFSPRMFPNNNKKVIINWKRFSNHLFDSISNPNPIITSKTQLDSAAKDLAIHFQNAIKNNSLTIDTESRELPINIQIALAKKRRLRRVWQHTRDPAAKTRLNRLIKEIREALFKYSTDEWHNTLDSFKPNDPKLFKIIRSLKTKKPPSNPLQGPVGLIYDPSSKAEAFADSLERQFTCPPVSAHISRLVQQKTQTLLQPHPLDVKFFSPKEVWDTIKSLPKKKAPGPDSISNTALRLSPKKAVLHLTKLFNSCLRLEHFPSPWKLATVIMIPKHGKNPTNPSNHRPISLLNTMAKLFETLILSRLKSATAHLIRPDQFAFRAGHSTTIQLTKLIDELATSFNKKLRTAAIFLDFEKAFDKVWHEGLLSKLIELKISTNLINIIKSFLENRRFRVRIEDHLSSERDIEAGVPQGSCISPLLFSLYINDMPSSPGTHTNLFADDTMFYHSSLNKHLAVKNLQKQVDLTIQWLKDWRISINPDKTVAILFGDKSNHNLKPIKIYNSDIRWTNYVKYLGVTIDSKLTFNKHISLICTRARCIRAALYPILNQQCPVPIRVKIRIIKMYITTILSYAGPAWGAYISKSNWSKLEAVQNIALRTSSGLPGYVRNSVLRSSLDSKSIKHTIIDTSKTLFQQIESSNHQHIKNIFNTPTTTEWKKVRPIKIISI